MNEKEILKECTELAENEHHELGNCWDEEYSSSAIFGLIMLYKQNKKELNNLKEIEKSHQEENGKLRIELEQYKLLEANIDKANKIIAENKFDEGLYGLLMQEKEKNKELEAKQIWNKLRIEELKKELVQEKEKSKELNEALERSSGHVTQLTVENSDLKYQLYHKQQMIDELTQSEEKLKIELGKEKERNELFVASGNSINLERHIKNNYISKDKIMDFIKEETKEGTYNFKTISAKRLKEFLEEK